MTPPLPLQPIGRNTAPALIGVATYSLTPHLPAAYQHLLPNEEEIRDRLQGWIEHGIT